MFLGFAFWDDRTVAEGSAYGTSTMTRFAVCGYRRGLRLPPRFAVRGWVSTIKAAPQTANRRRHAAKRRCVYNTAVCGTARGLRAAFWKWKNHLFCGAAGGLDLQNILKCWLKLYFYFKNSKKILSISEFSAVSTHIKFSVIYKK